MAVAPIIHLAPPDVDPDLARLAEQWIREGEEQAAAEERLLRAAVEALDRGDTAGAREILTRWLEEPAVTVAAGLKGVESSGPDERLRRPPGPRHNANLRGGARHD